MVQLQPITQASCTECERLEVLLDDLHRKNEAYWYLRSRVLELKDGDSNKSYFHHKASQRKKRNRIDGQLDDEGKWQNETEKLEEVVGKYYETLFTSSMPDSMQLQNVLDHVPRFITLSYNDILL